MKYIIIENFLNTETCKNLIEDSELYIGKENFSKIHGNRNSLENSSYEFSKLIKQSKAWRNLEKQINNKEFLKMCCEKLSLKNTLTLTNFFNKKYDSNIYRSYKNLSKKKINSIGTFTLFKYLLYRIYRNIIRVVGYSKIFFPNKIPTELLFDFSKAGNGYSREIHRDSDSRIIVFLIYLNSIKDLDNNQQQGGTLDLYELIDKNTNLSQPDLGNCKLIKKIEPKRGKLILFLNENDSYHAVSKIKNLEGHRYFIYGGFTSLSQKSPLITNNSRLKTEYHFYD